MIRRHLLFNLSSHIPFTKNCNYDRETSSFKAPTFQSPRITPTLWLGDIFFPSSHIPLIPRIVTLIVWHLLLKLPHSSHQESLHNSDKRHRSLFHFPLHTYYLHITGWLFWLVLPRKVLSMELVPPIRENLLSLPKMAKIPTKKSESTSQSLLHLYFLL